MIAGNLSSIKRAQKESVLFRLLSTFLQQISQDDPRVRDVFINRVQLASDRSGCTVFLYTAHGKEYFKELLEVLKLYKPSMRKAVADSFKARYVPDITFKFDAQFEKVQNIEQLIESIKDESSSD